MTWLVLVMVDNFLSVIELRLYRRGAHHHITLYDGSEINPFFAPNLGSKDILSLRTLIYMGSGYIFLWITWLMKDLSGNTLPTWEFASGMALLIHIPVMARHVRWIVFLSMAKEEEDELCIEGKIKCDPRFFHRQHSIDMYFMAIFCSVLLLATGKAFFAGGVLASIMVAILYWFRL